MELFLSWTISPNPFSWTISPNPFSWTNFPPPFLLDKFPLNTFLYCEKKQYYFDTTLPGLNEYNLERKKSCFLFKQQKNQHYLVKLRVSLTKRIIFQNVKTAFPLKNVVQRNCIQWFAVKFGCAIIDICALIILQK